jgi:hypothetical protein
VIDLGVGEEAPGAQLAAVRGHVLGVRAGDLDVADLLAVGGHGGARVGLGRDGLRERALALDGRELLAPQRLAVAQ